MGVIGNKYEALVRTMLTHCLKEVAKERNYFAFYNIIRNLNINLEEQYTNNGRFSEYKRYKISNEHAFQAMFTSNAIRTMIEEHRLDKTNMVLIDIGDSAGTHLKYQKELLKDSCENIKTISVNLDPVAIDKIRRGGGEAVLCRAEEYRTDDLNVSAYLSYEMVEHLHNPSIFFYRLAKADNGQYMIITVPYVKNSRVALGYSETHSNYDKITAEMEHVFELSPNDWKKLIRHSGWKTIKEEVYYQYPRKALLTPIYKHYWKTRDYEGFYGMVLERDMTVADKYTAWED